MWVIPTGTSSALGKKKSGKESQYMVSHPELGSDLPIGSDRESGCDKNIQKAKLPSAGHQAELAKEPKVLCSEVQRRFSEGRYT